MLHFGMGGVLAVGPHEAFTDQIRRVATFCGSEHVASAPDVARAKALLPRVRGLQLVAVDLALGRIAAGELIAHIHRAKEEAVRWAATVALVPANAGRKGPWDDLGYDAILPGPHGDTILEKRFRQVVLEAGADPGNLAQLEAVRELIVKGETARAEAIVRRGQRRYPNALEYVTLQCEIHLRHDRTRDALVLAMASLHAHPGWTPLRHLAARCYVLEGNISQAFIVLEQGTRDPRGTRYAAHFDTFEAVVKCLNNVGVVRAHEGDVHDAVSLYTHALEAGSGFPDHHRYVLWHNLGMAYRRAGLIPRARSALEKAVALAPPEFLGARAALEGVAAEERLFSDRPRAAALPAPKAANAAASRSGAHGKGKPKASEVLPAPEGASDAQMPGGLSGATQAALAPGGNVPAEGSDPHGEPALPSEDSFTFDALRSLGAAFGNLLPKRNKGTGDGTGTAESAAPQDEFESDDPAARAAHEGRTFPGLPSSPSPDTFSFERLEGSAATANAASANAVMDTSAHALAQDALDLGSVEGMDMADLDPSRDPFATDDALSLSDTSAGGAAAAAVAAVTSQAVQATQATQAAQAAAAGKETAAVQKAATAKAGKDGKAEMDSDPPLTDAQRREKRRKDKLRYVMFEKDLEEG